MTARKKPSAADYLGSLDESPAPSAAPDPGPDEVQPEVTPDGPMKMAAFRLPSSLAEELRGAAKALDADQADIVRSALERELGRLRRKYHDGEPFLRATPRRKRKL